MKKQEIYEIVANHLFTQGEQSKDTSRHEMCLYRGPNGTKCAVGVLITDEEMENLEEVEIAELVESPHFPKRLRPHFVLLQDLQRLHDSPWSWQSSQNMRTELRNVGRDNGLKTDFLNNLSFSDGR